VDEATREIIELLAGGLGEDYPGRRKRYVPNSKYKVISYWFS